MKSFNSKKKKYIYLNLMFIMRFIVEKVNHRYRIMLYHDISTLKDLINSVLEINKKDFQNIEKYDEEIYDENGDFIEIYNSREELLVKCIFYELNSIREYYLNSLKYDYILKISNNKNIIDKIYYNDLIKKHQDYFKILKKNNFNYDANDVKKYLSYIDKIENKSLIELWILYGDLNKIPCNIINKRDKDFLSLKTKEKKLYLKNFDIYHEIYNIKKWDSIENIRRITNSFKHRRGFKDFRDDDTSTIGEKYELSIDLAIDYINDLEIFFKELFIKIESMN